MQDTGGHRFGLIGAAGYIAPRHMRAIKETGNALLAAVDPNDSVGIIDSYFPNAAFFTEFERFDRHVDKLRRGGGGIDYVTICSPNYLHDAHIRFSLRSHAHAICEKPVVLTPWNVDALHELEREFGKRVYTILQLRHHPALIELRDHIAAGGSRKHEVDLTYLTSRGGWYHHSWKGAVEKSGGIASNIGVHFFDFLIWVFGAVQSSTVHLLDADAASGVMELERARVRWFLSINREYLPQSVRNKGKTTFRSIQVDGKEVEFSEGFTDLHNVSYQHILGGAGFGLKESRPAVELTHNIRKAKVVVPEGGYHPFLKDLAARGKRAAS